MSPRSRRFAEAVATAAAGSVLGGLAARAVGLGDVALTVAAVAGANGAISGWRQIYAWRRPTGVVAFVLDSTWSAPMTAAGLVGHAVGFVQRDSGYVADLSRRADRHVYRRGFTPRRGFATTLGPVVAGAGDVTSARRRRLVVDHEHVHCWQARWLGPAFPVLYVGWTVLGGAVGVVVWLLARRDQRFTDVVETFGYYLNPLEWWAYSRDGDWPPRGKVDGLGWSDPCCRPLVAVRADRGSPAAPR
ncbi:hypothetical protein [Ilumatobacter sp.]|uniref:hypothetical protein n=1 Tax=Ilumatobacter sp. TaxID=1967498 RepID=UPI003B51712C